MDDEPTSREVVYARPVTMRDVAALAGVGLKTVSRVVNDEPNVREATRARVQMAIDRLDYRRNLNASLLRRGGGGPPQPAFDTSESEGVGLEDALKLCLLVRDRQPALFARAALRWHARFCAETPGIGLEEGRVVLDLLSVLATDKPQIGARALRELLAAYNDSLAEPLRHWEAEREAIASRSAGI